MIKYLQVASSSNDLFTLAIQNWMEVVLMDFIAHIRKTDGAIQTVQEHLLEVKEIAEKHGEKIGIKYLAGLAGMLHDLGKFTIEFKTYIELAVHSPDQAPKRGSVDHSTAGGKFLYNLFHFQEDIYGALLAEIIGNAIISHHSYLHDYLNADLKSPYLKRVRDKSIPEFENTKKLFYQKVMDEESFDTYVNKAKSELKNFIDVEKKQNHAKQAMFLTKFIFSILIDADRTNSREFEENNYAEKAISNTELFSNYYEKLMEKLNSFKLNKEADTIINRLRTRMSEECDVHAEKPSGIYTLSIPTGGGKTLASFRYALKHATLYNKKRIIYIIPYTTIIEQNANEIRDILKDNYNILEHHSNVVSDDIEDDEADDGIVNGQQKIKLAKDNWDSPIIFTTMVQFLNTFYAYGSRNIRRLHNLSEAVIIFDEVQKVPVHCVSLFNHALNFLNKIGKSSIILCTATQPALDFVQNKLDIHPDSEIIDDIVQVSKKFKRVNIINKATQSIFNEDNLVDFIYEKLNVINNILIVLNTKGAVRDLYKKLVESNENIRVYHLSTSMCPNHRISILNEVKQKLIQNEKVICVSTQLIEAGVDISFECVIRSLAGVDSIAQAAGRCNRHGEKKIQNVYIIDYDKENLSRLKEISKGKEITKSILRDIEKDNSAFGGNILTHLSMKRYFKEFYTSFEFDLDYPIKNTNETIIQLLSAEPQNNNFFKDYITNYKKVPPLCIANSYQTAAKYFKVIDSPTTPVIVPYKEGQEIIAELNSDMKIEELSDLFQKAQQYSVNLYKYQMDLLKQNNRLITLFDNNIYILKEGAYDNEYGVNIEGDSKLELLSY